MAPAINRQALAMLVAIRNNAPRFIVADLHWRWASHPNNAADGSRKVNVIFVKVRHALAISCPFAAAFVRLCQVLYGPALLLAHEFPHSVRRVAKSALPTVYGRRFAAPSGIARWPALRGAFHGM